MLKRRYKVWDAESGSEDEAGNVDGLSAEEAAQEFAEADIEGQRDGIYRDPGRALHVRDADANVFEFRIVVSSMPFAVTMKASRVT